MGTAILPAALLRHQRIGTRCRSRRERLLCRAEIAARHPAAIRLRASHAQFLANGCGRVSYLLHGPLQFILRNAESLQPVLDLEILAHVDLAAIGLVSLREVIHLSSPLGARKTWSRSAGSYAAPVLTTSMSAQNLGRIRDAGL